MEMNAAVLYEWGQPLVWDRIRTTDPRSDEVLVRLAASGVCGSDVHLADGHLEIPGPHGSVPLPLPIVPGHEAAGVVEHVGSGVQAVTPGDHVVINIYPGCADARGAAQECQQRAQTCTRDTSQMGRHV